MATLFDQDQRIVPTWVAAANHLEKIPGRTDYNLVLEISDPTTVTEGDREVIKSVNEAFKAAPVDMSVRTARNTIFPYSLYQLHGRPGVYKAHHEIHQRSRKGGGGWGTYAQRMMNFTRKSDWGGHINQLERLVTKLTEQRTMAGQTFRNCYELVVAGEPGSESIDLGGEIPIFSPKKDAKRLLGGPCLSHVSVKLTTDEKLNLTAVYRNHYYCMRALGNLLGLMDLMRFIAQESGCASGVLTCVSTHAKLDIDAFGGVDAAKALLAAA